MTEAEAAAAPGKLLFELNSGLTDHQSETAGQNNQPCILILNA